MADDDTPNTVPVPSDLSALRAVAEAATPGRWGWRHFGNDPETPCRIVTFDVEPWKVVADEIWTPADAEHIATFDPPTVAALIDRVERAERERDEAVAEKGHAQSGVTAAKMLDEAWREAQAERDAVLAELAVLRAAVAGLADAKDRQGQESLMRDHDGNWWPAVILPSELRALLTEGADDGQ